MLVEGSVSPKSSSHEQSGTGGGGVAASSPVPFPESFSSARAPYMRWSGELQEQILDAVAGGLTLHRVSKLPGMPSYMTILRWAKERTDFREALLAVRTVRALHMEDQALELVERTDGMDPKDVAAARLKFDILRWGTEVNDPEVFGKRTTVQGSVGHQITFIMQTGVPAPEKAAIELTADGLIASKPIEAAIDAEVQPELPLTEGETHDSDSTGP